MSQAKTVLEYMKDLTAMLHFPVLYFHLHLFHIMLPEVASIGNVMLSLRIRVIIATRAFL